MESRVGNLSNLNNVSFNCYTKNGHFTSSPACLLIVAYRNTLIYNRFNDYITQSLGINKLEELTLRT